MTYRNICPETEWQQQAHAYSLQLRLTCAQAAARRKQAEHGLKRVQSQKAAVQKAIADVDTKSSSANGARPQHMNPVLLDDEKYFVPCLTFKYSRHDAADALQVAQTVYLDQCNRL